MLFIFGTLLVFLISIKVSAILSIGFLMIHFRIKRAIQQMTAQKWETYFDKIGPRGLFLRIIGYYWVALALITYWNMQNFWQGSWAYGLALLLAGAVRLIFRYTTKKTQFQQMMNDRFRS